MLDLVLINPAAYRGNPRRGPYELATLREQVCRGGYSASLLDLQEMIGRKLLPFPAAHIAAAEYALTEWPAGIALITLRTSGGPWALALAETYRRLHPESVVVAFAPRIEERLRRFMESGDAFDAMFVSRPEDVILDLVANVSSLRRAGLDRTPGLLIRQPDGRLHRTEAPANRAAVNDAVPTEPWISLDRSVAAVHVGRGCPDRCTFCAAHLGAGATPHYLAADRVVREAEHAYSRLDPRTPRFVMLETENLTSNRRLIEAIGRERSHRGYQFRWGAYGRIDHMNASMRRLLKESGCCFLFFGLETGSRRLQKTLGKRFDLDAVIPRIRALHRDRILTQSSFMFGIPGETFEDFVETARLMGAVVWAGGCVDWTPLRVEAGTAMERLVDGRPMRLLKNSELYVDLAEAGVDPETVDRDIGYRMYGVEIADFDIDDAVLVARAWRRLLMDAPLTAYVLHVGLKLDVATLLSRMRTDPSRSSQALYRWATGICRDALPAALPFIADLAAAELRPNLPPQREPRYNFDAFYGDIRRDPTTIPRVFALAWWPRHQEVIGGGEAASVN